MIALAAAGAGCGADFETETFSADLADGWNSSEDIADFVAGSASVSLDTASAEIVATLVPDDPPPGMVMIARYPSIPGGASDAASLQALIAGGSSGMPAGTPAPTPTELAEEQAYELNVPAVPAMGGASAGSARMLLSIHEGDAYAVIQIATDPATLAEQSIGFTKVVDSWEWKD